MKRLLTLASVLLFTVSLFAQPAMQYQPLPADTAYRIGTLPNGMKYYVRHNAKPQGLADFYILTDVGAIQEDDNQIGLAHFLEHMAFNGTQNMPDKAIINYCEAIGVRFGANLNAATGVEMTRYLMRDVPLTRDGIVDTVLLILHDWADRITLDSLEIDAERGVIIEELRQGRNAGRRLWDAERAVTFKGTRYVDRNIIGTEQGLRNFTYEDLRSFYRKWYNTSHQAIIAIGDFDADQMVERIKVAMNDIRPYDGDTQKQVIVVPDNKEPRVAILTDKELTTTTAQMIIKRQPYPKEYFGTQEFLRNNLIGSIGSMTMGYRNRDITQRSDAPFLGVWLSDMQLYNGALSATGISVSAKTGKILSALEPAYREIQRFLRYGVTKAEFNRAKAELYKAYENQYLARGDRRNSGFVNDASTNFLYGVSIPSDEYSHQLYKQLLDEITIEQVNEYFPKRWSDENRVIILKVAPDSTSTLPTEQQVLDIMRRVESEQIEAPVEEDVAQSLIADPSLLRGSKVKRTEPGMYGSTVWTLKNGIRVVLKPTDFEKGEVLLKAMAPEGTSSLPDSLVIPSNFFGGYFGRSGIGDYNAAQISKITAGKTAYTAMSLGAYESQIIGSSTPSDIETMMQKMYLQFTAPRYDSDAFAAMISNARNNYRNAEGKPSTVFSKRVGEILNGKDNPRRPWLDEASLDKVQESDMAVLHDKFFGNAGGYTFFITGNFSIDTIRPLVEKYIGSLPYDRKLRREWKDEGIRYPEGDLFDRFATKMETPKTQVYYIYWGNEPTTVQNIITGAAFSHIIGMRYHNIIREQMGGTYGVSASLSHSTQPTDRYVLSVVFNTNIEQSDTLRAVVPMVIADIADKGVTPEEVANARAYIQKNRPEQMKSNSYWQGRLASYYVNGKDFETGRDSAISDFTAEDMQAIAKRIVSDGNNIKIIMDPEQ